MSEIWLKHLLYNYEVSSLGRVRHALTKRVRKLRLDRDGYWRFNVKLPERLITLKAAVLVCEAFHGFRPADKPEVCHGLRGQQCDAADNLRWGTRSENLRDRKAFRYKPRLKPSEVRQIRALAASVSQVELSRRYDVSPSNVRSILSGQTWGGV